MNQLSVLQTLESLPLEEFKRLLRIRFEQLLNSQTQSPIVQNFLPPKRSAIAVRFDWEMEAAIAAQHQLLDEVTEEIFYAIVGNFANKLMEKSNAES